MQLVLYFWEDRREEKAFNIDVKELPVLKLNIVLGGR